MDFKNLPSALYKAMLFAATILWGAAFVIMKDAVSVLTPAQLVGVRFLLAGIVLAVFFRRQLKSVIRNKGIHAGIIMGAILFTAFWMQTLGLAYTTPGKNAFLTGTYCVMVPFILWLVTKRAPGIARVAAAFICVIGIGFVSLGDEGVAEAAIGFGDAVTLAGAVVFAVEIVGISRFSKKYDVIGITVIQFLTCGMLGVISGFSLEPMPPLSIVTPEFIGEMAYLVLLSSCLCYIFQNVGLAHVNASQGALILSLESVFGVISSVIFYGEVLTLKMVIGFALIFAAILLSELAPDRGGKTREEIVEMDLKKIGN